MARGGGQRRYSGVALVLLASLLVFGIALPIIVSFNSNRFSVGTSNLVAAPRDGFIVTSPIALGWSGMVTIERGTLYPADSSGRAMTVPLSAAQMTSGNARFVIENGQMRIQAGQTTASGDMQSPIIDALGSLQFEALILRNTTVGILLPDGRTETISDIDGEVTQRRKVALALKGQGTLRGQKVEIDATSGIPTDMRPGSTVPLKLALKSTALEVTLDGRVGFVGPVQLQGAVEFSAPHIRQVARWFGAVWPNGNGLRNLSGRGQLEWAGPAMAFNRATFLMDGNEANGTLNLKLAGARPSIGGTLALKTLDLSKYFPSHAAAGTGVLSSAWNVLLGSDLSLPLTQHFDADIRLSADKVRLGSYQLGRSAMTVTVSQGRMLADVGAFEIEGGRGSGQISADMNGPTPKLALRGKLDEIDAARATSNLFGHSVLSGRATLTTDISSTGKTGDDLQVASSGRLNISVRNGGKIGVDLRGLAAAAQKRAIDGWGTPGRGQTGFDELDATFSIRSGALVADEVKARSGDITTTLTGAIEVPTNRLNIKVIQEPVEDSASVEQPSRPLTAIQIFGIWGAPTVRNEGIRDRAAEPSRPPIKDTATTVTPARL